MSEPKTLSEYIRLIVDTAASDAIGCFGDRRQLGPAVIIAAIALVGFVVIWPLEQATSRLGEALVYGASVLLTVIAYFLFFLFIAPWKLHQTLQEENAELRVTLETARGEQGGGWLKHAGVLWKRRDDRSHLPDGPFCPEDRSILRTMSFTGSRGAGPASDADVVGGQMAGALFCPECDETFRVGPRNPEGMVLMTQITVRQLRREAGRRLNTDTTQPSGAEPGPQA